MDEQAEAALSQHYEATTPVVCAECGCIIRFEVWTKQHKNLVTHGLCADCYRQKLQEL